ncbi:hypothetical protein [Streptomyces synnematoformans]|uniref:Uncharacterized protein n=1 Tax=Streptomyces synnematoformans TaxID=415721 RepID=A0ABN2XEL5_9ACTN
MKNEPTFDPTMYLLTHEEHITTPAAGGPAPLPPPRGALWRHFGRIAPALATTALAGLAWTWNLQLPEGSTQPLWICGSLAVLAAAAGALSASQPNGDTVTTRTALAGGGVLALLGTIAWTPHVSLAALLWAASTAAVYAICAPLWRTDRRLAREQAHAQQLAETKARAAAQVAALDAQARITGAQYEYRAEVARVEGITRAVEAITAAEEAKADRTLAPGEELSVSALLRAAGHDRPAPVELPARDRAGEWRSQETG